ncbi:MAG TPA: hypothetical protein DDZ51_12625 [Planctomycetaceae bacterium]|nr:hypothetical protein [Planctomycetaceae bacterium]
MAAIEAGSRRQPLSNDDISNLADETLSELSRNCAEMIQSVCVRLEDPDLIASIRRLMQSSDLLETFAQIQQEDRSIANMILNAGLATLVNSQSVIAIDNEFRRRAAERN